MMKETAMIKLAVVGQLVTSGLGIARQCMTCYRWQPSYGGVPCFGFGAGCIEYRPKAGCSQKIKVILVG